MPVCTACKEDKPETEFYAKHVRCKPCVRAANNARRWANREKDITRKRLYRLEHHEEELEKERLRRERDHVKIRQREAIYRATHLEIIKTRDGMKTAKRRGALIIEPINPYEIARRDNWLCHLCHKPVKPEQLTVDHLTPITYGGNHTPDNVALAHKSCNSRRGAGRIIAQLRFW
jgi:5-methylcytosine-specific restriction endonuclease McrA